MSTAFLTARWEHLALLNFRVKEEQLATYVPTEMELDRREGACYVSVVAFDFANVRVKGCAHHPWRRFPEINLRFYVRERTGEQRRGVMFIREYVPVRTVAAVARWMYHEPYKHAAMNSRVEKRSGRVFVRHEIHTGGRTHILCADASANAITPEVHTTEHWFKEHEWGFGVDRHGRRLVYRVVHPVWRIFEGATATLDMNFAAMYGEAWSSLDGRLPDSVVLAEGSEIEVWPHTSVT